MEQEIIKRFGCISLDAKQAGLVQWGGGMVRNLSQQRGWY